MSKNKKKCNLTLQASLPSQEFVADVLKNKLILLWNMESLKKNDLYVNIKQVVEFFFETPKTRPYLLILSDGREKC